MYPPFKGHPWKPSLDPIHNHHQSNYHTFYHSSELIGPHLWSKAQGRQGLTQVFLQAARHWLSKKGFKHGCQMLSISWQRICFWAEILVGSWKLCSRVVRTSQRLTKLTMALIGYCTCSAHWIEPESGDWVGLSVVHAQYTLRTYTASPTSPAYARKIRSLSKRENSETNTTIISWVMQTLTHLQDPSEAACHPTEDSWWLNSTFDKQNEAIFSSGKIQPLVRWWSSVGWLFCRTLTPLERMLVGQILVEE